MVNIFEQTCSELTSLFKERYGKGAYHSQALMREILKKGNMDFHLAEEFRRSASLAEQLKKDVVISVPEITRIVSEDDTIKFTVRMEDGNEAESVVIPMQNHNTLCVSCQIGCKMACRFCETGNMGFTRNLSPAEIVGQVYAARFILKKTIKNIVFMGMGEPFDNFEHVMRAIEILNDQRGFDIAHSHITVSTAGLVKGIKALGQSGLHRLHLAVSLNAPNDTIRSQLMPITIKHPMAEIKQALLDFPLPSRGVFLMGYVLIPGINDSPEHAEELADFLSPLPVRLNVIPLNKTSVFHHEPASDEDIHRFATFLEKRGVFVIKRWSRGARLLAGCGQLGKRDSSVIP
ncbi:MAG: 23S rRNA (adenine(2503)-C(2))-methyltransferase RlmN [Desulfobacteraceae bacterium]